jgi:hydrogenase nickel incorporation protein HypA/HybF
MHELSIAVALVLQVQEVAAREDATRVVRVVVVVGRLSGVEPDALEFAWPLAAEGTVAAHAELILEAPPLTLRCRSCGLTAEGNEPFPVCDACGSVDVDVGNARELRLKTIDVE